jgi:hypothetical protein
MRHSTKSRGVSRPNVSTVKVRKAYVPVYVLGEMAIALDEAGATVTVQLGYSVRYGAEWKLAAVASRDPYLWRERVTGSLIGFNPWSWLDSD